MKIKNKILPLVLLLTLASNLNWAQGNVPFNVVADGNFVSVANTPEDALGSAYIPEEFSAVKIQGFDNKIFSARFNALNDQMEIITGANQSPIALDISTKEYEVHFLNLNKTYKVLNYINKNGAQNRGFLVEVLINEKIKLFKKEVITYVPMTPATSSYDKDKPAKFDRQDDEYYLCLNSKKCLYLPPKDKDIAKAFPEHSKEIMAFVKKNKLKTKKEEDLIKVANFIGSL
jgi:hypothetical protein